MPPDTRQTKIGFVLIGAASVLFIIVAGAINMISQNRLSEAIRSLTDDVHKLAYSTNAAPDASVDQILAAAATKLIHQDKEIQDLRSKLDPITHPENGIYLNGSLVGIAEGERRFEPNKIEFQRVTTGAKGLDFSKIYQYRELKLKCEPPGIVGTNGRMGITDQTIYGGLLCMAESSK